MALCYACHAMGLDEAMIVAGIGCKSGVSPGAILAAIDAALTEYRSERSALAGVATGSTKRDEPAIVVAAATLGVPVHYVGEDALADVAPRVKTISEKSQRTTGSPSLSEAAALAAAGEDGRLLGPRIISGAVTCALASMGMLA